MHMGSTAAKHGGLGNEWSLERGNAAPSGKRLNGSGLATMLASEPSSPSCSGRDLELLGLGHPGSDVAAEQPDLLHVFGLQEHLGVKLFVIGDHHPFGFGLA